MPGTSADSSSCDDVEPDMPLDKQATLGLNNKDLTRQPKQVVLEDLSSRQLAAALAGVFDFVLPSDLAELGGEYASWAHIFRVRSRRQGTWSLLLTRLAVLCACFLASVFLPYVSMQQNLRRAWNGL